MKNISKKNLIAELVAIFVLVSACNEQSTPPDIKGEDPNTTALVGTKWRLVAFVDVENNITREPDYCLAMCNQQFMDSVYLLSFDTDTLLSGKSFSNNLFGIYHIDSVSNKLSMKIGGTEINEFGDGVLYVRTLNRTQYFNIAYTNPATLDLYYDDGKNILRFTKTGEDNYEKAKVFFRTNVHSFVNCVSCSVDVFVDDEFIGTLTEPSPVALQLDTVALPCSYIAMYETNVPKTIRYNFKFKGASNAPTYDGKLDIKKVDSCYEVFWNFMEE